MDKTASSVSPARAIRLFRSRGPLRNGWYRTLKRWYEDCRKQIVLMTFKGLSETLPSLCTADLNRCNTCVSVQRFVAAVAPKCRRVVRTSPERNRSASGTLLHFWVATRPRAEHVHTRSLSPELTQSRLLTMSLSYFGLCNYQIW